MSVVFVDLVSNSAVVGWPPLSVSHYVHAHVYPYFRSCFMCAIPYRAMVDKNPRKLQWKTPTYGPLVRPYHPFKEVGSPSFET